MQEQCTGKQRRRVSSTRHRHWWRVGSRATAGKAQQQRASGSTSSSQPPYAGGDLQDKRKHHRQLILICSLFSNLFFLFYLLRLESAVLSRLVCVFLLLLLCFRWTIWSGGVSVMGEGDGPVVEDLGCCCEILQVWLAAGDRRGTCWLKEKKGELRWLRDEKGWFAREPEKEEETVVGGGVFVTGGSRKKIRTRAGFWTRRSKDCFAVWR